MIHLPQVASVLSVIASVSPEDRAAFFTSSLNSRVRSTTSWAGTSLEQIMTRGSVQEYASVVDTVVAMTQTLLATHSTLRAAFNAYDLVRVCACW